MIRLSTITLAFASVLAVAGSAFAADPIEVEARKTTCTETLDATTGHFVTLTSEGNVLTEIESLPNARFAPVSYAMTPVALITAPVETPKFSCGTGTKNIVVWDEATVAVVRVGGAYFQLAPVN
jgi:hypothetical protein